MTDQSQITSPFEQKNLLERYQRDGFLCPLDYLSEQEINQYRVSFDALERKEGRERSVIQLRGRHQDQHFVWELATKRALLDIIESLIGPDILLLSTHFFCKYPSASDGHFVDWHQDVAYWGLEPATAVTAWIAIDDSNRDNGCMEVIPGSHRGGVVTHENSLRPNNLLASNQAIPEQLLDLGSIQAFELRAGQISIHDGSLVHASRPNQSAKRRCGLTVRFIAPSVRQARANNTGGYWQPILVRGADTYGHFEPRSRPFA